MQRLAEQPAHDAGRRTEDERDTLTARIALDANVRVCAGGGNWRQRKHAALALLRGLGESDVLGGLFVARTRQAGRNAGARRDAVLGWSDSLALIGATPAGIRQAMEPVALTRGLLGFRDAGSRRADRPTLPAVGAYA